jgi:hypothetical protein
LILAFTKLYRYILPFFAALFFDAVDGGFAGTGEQQIKKG